MPRTKVTKSSKRNREASYREDKVREFEAAFEEFEKKLDIMAMSQTTSIAGSLDILISRASKSLLQLSCEVLFDNLDLNSEWKQDTSSVTASTSTLMRSTTKMSNPNDEGYLTEDSSASSSLGASAQLLRPLQTHNYQQQQSAQLQRGMTPAGPLSSARFRRPRRSRSACGSAVKATPSVQASVSASEHMARNKMRTPMASRPRALSADRNAQAAYLGGGQGSSPQSPPAAFMRWPKPGEMVLSMCGSPVVAQVMPEKFANVNIPTKNGVLSLRPKKLDQQKLDELKPDLLDSLDPETLQQIKTLHASLDLIVNRANMASSSK